MFTSFLLWVSALFPAQTPVDSLTDGVLAQVEAPYPVAVDLTYATEAHETADVRTFFADLTPLNTERDGVWITYDLGAVTRRVRRAEMPAEPELSVAVRLALSEVGPHRLLESRYGVLEAAGIYESVYNRMDPAVYNPQGAERVAIFEGCGDEGAFGTCANPDQYLGLRMPIARNPGDDPRTTQAVDQAVLAWWLLQQGILEDVTQGATNFVHRCGGAAYGRVTMACDGKGTDVPGAKSTTGPILFKAPGELRRGYYRVEPTVAIDYDLSTSPWAEGEWHDYLESRG